MSTWVIYADEESLVRVEDWDAAASWEEVVRLEGTHAADTATEDQAELDALLPVGVSFEEGDSSTLSQSGLLFDLSGLPPAAQAITATLSIYQQGAPEVAGGPDYPAFWAGFAIRDWETEDMATQQELNGEYVHEVATDLVGPYPVLVEMAGVDIVGGRHQALFTQYLGGTLPVLLYARLQRTASQQEDLQGGVSFLSPLTADPAQIPALIVSWTPVSILPEGQGVTIGGISGGGLSGSPTAAYAP